MPTTPKVLKIAENGIRTPETFASALSALMADVLEGNISPEVGEAISDTAEELMKAKDWIGLETIIKELILPPKPNSMESS